MALPSKPFHLFFYFVMTAASVNPAIAQSLNQENPLDRLSDVVQFGLPRDAKFVFCDGEGCPERSIKHLFVPPPPPQQPAAQAPTMLIPAAVPKFVSPPEISPAKGPAAKSPVKKKRKKSATHSECKTFTKER